MTTLSASAASAAAAVDALPRGYGTLGRYALLETIGHGGMGVVWKAYDPLLDRKIALKLLASATAAHGTIVAEAQAMARLQHPNVITVYDAGVQAAGGRALAYIAMELVEGRTLKQWLDAAPRPLAERVELFMLAGRGLAAAHDAGLVHRDFKPSNVLLGDDGRVRVSDFGLALFGGGEGAAPGGSPAAPPEGAATTLFSPFAGTPRYMAPEQLHGLPAEARANQFAFCVALYEAVYGTHPFAGDGEPSVRELRERILALPTPPARSRLAARLAPAILRGLAADPARRWGSMRELLAALEEARGARGRRLMLGAGVGLSILVATVLGWREATSPSRACARAADALDATFGAARRHRLGDAFAALADGHGAEAWRRVTAAIDDWSGRWRTLRIEACEAERNGRAPSPTLTARRECLDRRLGELAGLVQALEQPTRAVALYATRAAHSLTPPESCLAATPPVEARAAAPALREGRDRVAAVRARIDRAAALGALDQEHAALDEAKEAAAAAGQVGWAPLVAEAQLELGRAELDVNATDAATDGFYQALWHAEAARDDALRLEASMGLFKASLNASSYALAARWNQTDKAIAGHLPAEGTRQARLAFDDQRLAMYRGEWKRCLAAGQEALGLAEKAAPTSPLVVSVMINLARCYGSVENGTEAVATLERALPMAEKINGHESQQVASVLTELGIRERKAHHYDAAIARYREALAIRERMVGPDNPDCAAVHNNIGNVLRDQKRYGESKAELERAVAIWTTAWSAESPAVAVGLGGLGKVAMDQGRFAEAEDYFRRAVAITRKKRPPATPTCRAICRSSAPRCSPRRSPRRSPSSRRRAPASTRTATPPPAIAPTPASRWRAPASSSAFAAPAPWPKRRARVARSMDPSGRTGSASAAPGWPRTRQGPVDRHALGEHALGHRRRRRRRGRRHPARRRRGHAHHLRAGGQRGRDRPRSRLRRRDRARVAVAPPRAPQARHAADRRGSRLEERHPRGAQPARARRGAAAVRRRELPHRALLAGGGALAALARAVDAAWRRGAARVDPTGARPGSLLSDIALSGINVLILGETGVGKEMLAETLHRAVAARRRLRLHQLRGDRARAHRERALRPREGAPSPAPPRRAQGLLEAADGRHRVPRRGRRAAARRRRPSSSARSSGVRSSGSAPRGRWRSTCASSPRPTAICRARCRPAASAATSTFASTA